MFDGERLRELGLFAWRRGGSGDLMAPLSSLTGGFSQAGSGLFCCACSETPRGNRLKGDSY